MLIQLLYFGLLCVWLGHISVLSFQLQQSSGATSDQIAFPESYANMWPQQPEGLVPVLGDGLLGGKQQVLITRKNLGGVYSEAEILDFIITLPSGSRNGVCDPCIYGCGHIPGSSGLPTRHNQSACCSGRKCINVASMECKMLLECDFCLCWIQMFIRVFFPPSPTSQTHPLAVAAQQAASVCTTSLTTPASSTIAATICAGPTANTTGERS